MSEGRKIWAVQGFDGGLVTNYPAHAIDGDQSQDAENFDPSVRWKLQKRLGTSNFSGDKGSPTGTLVRGLIAFAFENGTAKIIAKEGTVIADITAGDWTTNLSGYTLTDAAEVYFSVFKNVLITTSSTYISPLKWSGSGAMASLGGSPPAAQYSAVHKGRLFLFKTSADPSRWYCSAVNNHEDWSTADNATNDYINPGDGMLLNGGASDGDVLYFSKIAPGGTEGGIYGVWGDGPSSFATKRIAFFGAVNPRCIIQTQNFVVAACNNGIWALQGKDTLLLSDAVNNIWTGLTAAQKAVACMGAYKDQIWIAYPASGSTNTKVLVCDVQLKKWSRYSFPASTAPYILTTHPDGTLYGASPTTTIRVVKYNTGATDIGSTAITQYWNTPDLDFGLWYADKYLKQWSLHCKNQAVTWTITHKINGTDSGDSVTMVGNTEGPVKVFDSKKTEPYGRFFSFQFSEANTTLTGELYGFAAEADEFPRTR